MLRKLSGIMFFWFCQRSPAKMPAHQIITLKQMKKPMFFLETTKIIKVTIFINVSRLLYLTDPIHPTKRYNNLIGFRDILGFICPTRGLLEGPGLDSDTFDICWPGWLGGAEFSDSSTKTDQKSTRKKKKKQKLLVTFTHKTNYFLWFLMIWGFFHSPPKNFKFWDNKVAMLFFYYLGLLRRYCGQPYPLSTIPCLLITARQRRLGLFPFRLVWRSLFSASARRLLVLHRKGRTSTREHFFKLHQGIVLVAYLK